MPTPHPPEFRRRAVELARTGDKSISALAKSLGISQSCLSNWVSQADRDEGVRSDGGLTTAEKKELAGLLAHQERAGGTAELKGRILAERSRRLIAAAHPDFREDLERGAHTCRGGTGRGRPRAVLRRS